MDSSFLRRGAQCHQNGLLRSQVPQLRQGRRRQRIRRSVSRSPTTLYIRKTREVQLRCASLFHWIVYDGTKDIRSACYRLERSCPLPVNKSLKAVLFLVASAILTR